MESTLSSSTDFQTFNCFSALSSVLAASVSVPGLPDLVKRSQNPLLCSVDHWEWRPSLGHWRSRPHRLGAAPQFWKAEVALQLNIPESKSLNLSLDPYSVPSASFHSAV